MMAFLATRGFKFDPDRDFKLKRQNLERVSRVGEVIHNHTGRTGAVDGLDRALLARNGLDRQYAHLTHHTDIDPRTLIAAMLGTRPLPTGLRLLQTLP